MLKKGDFVEIEFVGKIKETSQVFDTTSKEEAIKAGLIEKNEKNEKIKDEKIAPAKICIGEGMLIKGLDEALEGKEIGKNYSLEISPENAFGERVSELVKVFGIAFFRKQKIEPVVGMTLNIDGILARIIAVSGGRVIVDFNNPLAGKVVVYDFKILRKIENQEEKLEVLAKYYFGKAEIKKNEKYFVEIGKVPEIIKENFKKKTKELLNIEVEIKEKIKEK